MGFDIAKILVETLFIAKAEISAALGISCAVLKTGYLDAMTCCREDRNVRRNGTPLFFTLRREQFPVI
jgi:hypothetical protein